jgi:Flavoprotein
VHDESTERSFPNGILYLVVSGAPAPEGVPALVRRCQDAGWRIVVFSTPAGTRFIDLGELEQLTGEPVRSEYRLPGTGKAAPTADALLACPLTFNSVNKFAHGHADNFASACSARWLDTACRLSSCRTANLRWRDIRRSWRVWRRSAAWASVSCSIQMPRTSRGCRPGARLSPRSQPVYGPSDGDGPGDTETADGWAPKMVVNRSRTDGLEALELEIGP